MKLPEILDHYYTLADPQHEMPQDPESAQEYLKLVKLLKEHHISTVEELETLLGIADAALKDY